MISVGAMDVRVIVDRVHLMHTNARQLACVRVERVDQRPRLPVRERHDDVSVGRDVGEHGLGR